MKLFSKIHQISQNGVKNRLVLPCDMIFASDLLVLVVVVQMRFEKEGGQSLCSSERIAKFAFCIVLSVRLWNWKR